jgi:glucose-1-phosphatase
MIDAIIFDLGNVLIEVREDVALQRLGERTGKTPRALADYVMLTPFVTQLARGELTPQRFFQIAAQDLEFTGTFDEFAWIWSDIFAPIEPMIALAQSLQGRYRRYVLSNTNAIHADFFVPRYPFLRELDGWVFSHEVGLLKPDPQIYRLTLERFGLQPDRTVFIDDLAANAEGARAVGLHAIHHRGFDNTCRELTKLGVLPI